MSDKFTKKQRKGLEVFVTSATDHICAVKNTLPVEVFGAIGSFFSRNPKDFRAHLLDAILGRIRGFEIEGGEENLERLIQGEFQPPHLAILSGIAKSRKFFETYYGGYSHKSIANTVWIPMVATNKSQLFARELAYEQLAFFIEQSTRFVDFSASGMFHDPDLMASRHKDTSMHALEALGNGYSQILKFATEFYQRQTPLNRWLELQSDAVRGWSGEEQRTKYDREIRGQALDVARFLLPQAIRTNIAWICDARSTEFDIAAWKNHPLREMRDAAGLIKKHAGEIAPSLLRYTEPNEYYGDCLQGHGGALAAEPGKPFTKGVYLISTGEGVLDRFVAHIIQQHNRGGTFQQRLAKVGKMDFSAKMRLLERVTEKRGDRDEWIETDEAADLVKITFGIRSDVGAVRDWRRHQKWDRGEALYTLDNGFHMPHMIEEMHPDAARIFRRAMDVAHDAEVQIRKDFPFQAQYIIPMAANHEIIFSGGLDQLQYMLWTRSTPQGNFSYRQDAFNIAETVVKAMPWLWGYETYPSGKDLRTVYAGRPLKNLLRLQMGETALHQ